MLEKIILLIAKSRKIDPATLGRNTSFQIDLKMDSMSIVQSILEIEEKFKIEIPEKKLFKMKTIGDLVDFLEQKLGKTVALA